MAKALLLSLSLAFVLLFHGSLARSAYKPQQQNQCQLDRLEALEPDIRIEAEAGFIDTWNPNHDQFQCTGVAVVRCTMEQNGLHLPFYANAPHIIHTLQGI